MSAEEKERLVQEAAAMRYRFTIPGRLPSVNDMIEASSHRRGMWSEWNKMKKDEEERVIQAIEAAGKPKHMFTEPAVIEFRYYEKDRRRDIDNITGAAHKIILDALQRAEVIRNDNRHYVTRMADEVFTDPAEPRIEVAIRTLTADEKREEN